MQWVPTAWSRIRLGIAPSSGQPWYPVTAATRWETPNQVGTVAAGQSAISPRDFLEASAPAPARNATPTAARAMRLRLLIGPAEADPFRAQQPSTPEGGTAVLRSQLPSAPQLAEDSDEADSASSGFKSPPLVSVSGGGSDAAEKAKAVPLSCDFNLT